MKEFQVAICDDEQFYIDDICGYLKAYMSEEDVVLHVSTYTSGLDLLKDMRENNKSFDMFFLDIDMPLYTGVDTAMEIRKEDEDVAICFVTSHRQYAFDAYQIDAIAYLEKPATYVGLKTVLNKCVVHTRYLRDRKMAEETYLEIRYQNQNEILQMKKIKYIEKERNRCIIHMVDDEVICYETLASIYERLDKSSFFYTHQGYIVNFNHILQVFQNKIYVTGGFDIPVSRKYYKELADMHRDKINRIRKEKYTELGIQTC